MSRSKLMYSMTGYGRAEGKKDGFEVLVEVKTVNNRNLDLITKIPRAFISFEDALRKTVSSRLNRGRVELFISYVDTNDSEVNLSLDKNLAKAYTEVAKKLSTDYGVPFDLTASSLMRMPEVIKETDAFGDFSHLSEMVTQTLSTALDNLIEMRRIEGEKLKTDMLNRLCEIEKTVNAIKQRAPLVAVEHRKKLTERIKEILGDTNYDESRLLNEVAFFTDKANIDEELTRLTSHIAQFRSICNGTVSGKKLDFLIQEFNREANTICSKANDIEVTSLGLTLKSDIEKIREQVQNVE